MSSPGFWEEVSDTSDPGVYAVRLTQHYAERRPGEQPPWPPTPEFWTTDSDAISGAEMWLSDRCDWSDGTTTWNGPFEILMYKSTASSYPSNLFGRVNLEKLKLEIEAGWFDREYPVSYEDLLKEWDISYPLNDAQQEIFVGLLGGGGGGQQDKR